MPRRGENIYKRKDGRWEARVLKKDGKYFYLYAKTYKEVKDKKNNFKEFMEQKTVSITNENTNCSDIFIQWLEKDVFDRVKTSTYESYSNCIYNYVIPFFQNKKNVSLSKDAITLFAASICEEQTLSNAYKRKLLTIFKTAVKDISKNNIVSSNMINSIRLPKVENKEIQIFSMKEQRMIESILFQQGNIRSLGILLAFYTGIRLGELCALKWSDFDFETGIMSISKTVSRVKSKQTEEKKTMLIVGTPKSQKSIRKIPLPAFFQSIYKELQSTETNKDYYLFSGTRKPADPRTYQKQFKKILFKIGVKDCKFHAIRHTFATRALELGVDIKTLSEILGHSNVTITLNIYAHSMIEQKKIVMDRFNELYISNNLATSFIVNNSVINKERY